MASWPTDSEQEVERKRMENLQAVKVLARIPGFPNLAEMALETLVAETGPPSEKVKVGQLSVVPRRCM